MKPAITFCFHDDNEPVKPSTVPIKSSDDPSAKFDFPIDGQVDLIKRNPLHLSSFKLDSLNKSTYFENKTKSVSVETSDFGIQAETCIHKSPCGFKKDSKEMGKNK